jgi:cytochrome oxidase Cu insertion factor (SCO1/SenC/PrrC family)
MTSDLRTQRTKLLVVVALFFVPLAVAFWMYYGSTWRPQGSTSHGQLLLPTRTVPADIAALHGKWTLLHIAEGRCEDSCQRALLVARQTRLSLNQDAGRVARVLMAAAGCCDQAQLDEAHPGLLRLDPASLADGGAALRAAFPADGHADALYVLDPLGNVVMRFDINAKPKDLLTDLKKLLNLSSIG